MFVNIRVMVHISNIYMHISVCLLQTHTHTIKGGHYYVFVRPSAHKDITQGWLKFNDTQVTYATVQEVLEHNFGKNAVVDPPNNNKKNISSSVSVSASDSIMVRRLRRIPSMKKKKRSAIGARTAYMLIYVQKHIAKDMFCELSEREIPASLRVCVHMCVVRCMMYYV